MDDLYKVPRCPKSAEAGHRGQAQGLFSLVCHRGGIDRADLMSAHITVFVLRMAPRLTSNLGDEDPQESPCPALASRMFGLPGGRGWVLSFGH